MTPLEITWVAKSSKIPVARQFSIKTQPRKLAIGSMPQGANRFDPSEIFGEAGHAEMRNPDPNEGDGSAGEGGFGSGGDGDPNQGGGSPRYVTFTCRQDLLCLLLALFLIFVALFIWLLLRSPPCAT